PPVPAEPPQAKANSAATASKTDLLLLMESKDRSWMGWPIIPTKVLSVPSDLLSSIGICVAAAALLALAGHRLRQPLILAYLVTGVLIGPVGFDLVKDRESIQTVAEIGLILLLFMIGLEIDLKKLVAAGRPVLVAGALQVPICVGLGLAFFYWLGFRDAGEEGKAEADADRHLE